MNADDLPIGTRVRPIYPGRPDWVVYRKVDDGPWGWCLERAGGAIESREITQRFADGSIEIAIGDQGSTDEADVACASTGHAPVIINPNDGFGYCQCGERRGALNYRNALAVAARALLDAVTDVYVAPVPEEDQKAARARLGLAHQNLERLLAANGDLP